MWVRCVSWSDRPLSTSSSASDSTSVTDWHVLLSNDRHETSRRSTRHFSSTVFTASRSARRCFRTTPPVLQRCRRPSILVRHHASRPSHPRLCSSGRVSHVVRTPARLYGKAQAQTPRQPPVQDSGRERTDSGRERTRLRPRGIEHTSTRDHGNAPGLEQQSRQRQISPSDLATRRYTSARRSPPRRRLHASEHQPTRPARLSSLQSQTARREDGSTHGQLAIVTCLISGSTHGRRQRTTGLDDGSNVPPDGCISRLPVSEPPRG